MVTGKIQVIELILMVEWQKLVLGQCEKGYMISYRTDNLFKFPMISYRTDNLFKFPMSRASP